MKQKKIILMIIVALFNHKAQAITFQGLIETDISKNNFLCTNAATSSVACVDCTGPAVNFNLNNKPILQLFNDQPYWLHQEALAEQYASESLTYTGSELQNYLNSHGWGAMGGFCILIIIDPLLTNFAAPNLIAKPNQEKLIVQLWYNGDNTLELWSQDIQIVDKNAQFKIKVSSSVDPLTSIKNENSETETAKNKFLKSLQLQPLNRKDSTYQMASKSPRSIKIQVLN